jgi:tRNA pseudouridine38-40 synthase
VEYPHFLRVAYLGTAFSGWQIQSTLRTVQGDLWAALRKLDPGAPMPQGTGRTDAGVHAKDQGVLIVCPKPWESYRLLAALNAHLPPDIRVMEAGPAPEGFFPRHHAVAKRYVYRMAEGPAKSPFDEGRRFHVFGADPLDRRAMAEAAAHLRGRHDFAGFRSPECVAKTTERVVHDLRMEGAFPRLDLVFEGDRFLMHQVRIMAGTLIDVGKGRIRAADIPRILASKDRVQAGQTAPAEGLWLDRVWFQARFGLGDPCPWGENS